MKEKLLVVKIGGNIIDNEEKLTSFLLAFSSIPAKKILIHGGGKLATELSTKLGIETRMHQGRRITDAETLKVTTMTYAGWVNKKMAATLCAYGCPAIGLSGADVNLIPAVKRPVGEVDFGFVGDIKTEDVNNDFLRNLLNQNIVPVIAPITADRSGQLLNTNADTIAQSIAISMSGMFETQLVYCFEKKGLLRDRFDDNSVVTHVTPASASSLKEQHVIIDGMIPKVDNALHAISSGVTNVVIGHADDILKIANNDPGYGTTISAE